MTTAAERKNNQYDQDLGSSDVARGWRRVDPRAQHFGLSERELHVLGLIADGLSDKEIAARLAVSRFTVNKHVSTIIRKMRSASRTEAAVRALRAGLID